MSQQEVAELEVVARALKSAGAASLDALEQARALGCDVRAVDVATIQTRLIEQLPAQLARKAGAVVQRDFGKEA